MVDLYLASQSPRRRQLLEQIGVRFGIISIDVTEQRQLGEAPRDYVSRLSVEKAKAGVEEQNGQQVPVLGADTIVVLGDEMMEKPVSESDAIDMLLCLSGNKHRVITSVSLCQKMSDADIQCQSRLSETEVQFRKISRTEAQYYWQTGEPADKAGGYAIQGLVVFLWSAYKVVIPPWWDCRC